MPTAEKTKPYLVSIDFQNNDRIVIVDIDGILADHRHRLHYLSGHKDWESFFSESDKDEPYEWCIKLVKTLKGAGFQIHLVTGRPARIRGLTEDWLAKYKVPYDRLITRANGDRRQDYIVKEEILKEFFNKKDIEFVIDDRQKVVDMWRDNGLVCLQCRPDEEL